MKSKLSRTSRNVKHANIGANWNTLLKSGKVLRKKCSKAPSGEKTITLSLDFYTETLYLNKDET